MFEILHPSGSIVCYSEVWTSSFSLSLPRGSSYGEADRLGSSRVSDSHSRSNRDDGIRHDNSRHRGIYSRGACHSGSHPGSGGQVAPPCRRTS